MHNFARTGAAAVASLLLLLAPATQAQEIYKWVDKDGKTHYSQRKEDAGGAATSTVRPGPAAAPAPSTGTGPIPSSQASNEEVIRRAASNPYEQKTLQPPVLQKPAARAANAESPAAKCQLAKDILAGKLEYSNGTKIDAYGRQVAESDVRTFCGQ